MNYQTFIPHPDLASLVKCYWTLEVPLDYEGSRIQRIVPDGCIEMAFILGDDIKRHTPEGGFLIQPRAMVLGQITEPFFIEPTGYVNSFDVRFYPHGFANFAPIPIHELANKETPLPALFEKELASALELKIVRAPDTDARIKIVEDFLFDRLTSKATMDSLIKSTVEMIFSTRGGEAIHSILRNDLSKRRQLERKFHKNVGLSPKQLGRVIRLQTALKMMLHHPPESLTEIAYESEYYDQAHFIKDFKEFTGINPKEFLQDDRMALSSIIYSED